MTSRIQLVAILILSILVFTCQVYGYGDFEKARNAVVRIEVDKNKIGTGVIVKMIENTEGDNKNSATAIILTAWHVVSNDGEVSKNIKVRFYKKSDSYSAESLDDYISVSSDIAYLQVKNVPRNLRLPTIELVSAKKFEGREEVFIISHLTSGGDWNLISTRAINKIDRKFLIMSYGVIDLGSSGAPVLNKEAKMIAMVQELDKNIITIDMDAPQCVDAKIIAKLEEELQKLAQTLDKSTTIRAIKSDDIMSSIEEFRLGPLPHVGLAPKRKAGWILSSISLASMVGTAFDYYYYRQAQSNWDNAKTTQESDKFDRQRKIRGVTAVSLAVTALTTGITGLYLLLSEGAPPAAILPEIGYNDVTGDSYLSLGIRYPF